LLLTEDPMPEVTPTAILSRDLQRLQRIAKHDDEGGGGGGGGVGWERL